MPWISSPSIGTGTPHFRSRVTGVGFKPAFNRASMISPSEFITALGDHFPAFHDFLIHSSVCGWMVSSLRYMCAVVRLITLWVWVASIAQWGLINSMASNVRPQASHWSPRPSLGRINKIIDNDGPSLPRYHSKDIFLRQIDQPRIYIDGSARMCARGVVEILVAAFTKRLFLMCFF